MSEYKLMSDSIVVPSGTGVEGFVHTVRSILKLSRVQSVHIDAKGKVTYERYTKDDEEVTIGDVGFEDLEPWPLIRNRDVEEVVSVSVDPARIILEMFNMASNDGFSPTAFVTGANSVLNLWMSAGGRVVPVANSLFGLQVYGDRQLPDTVLVLTAAYSKDAGLVDTQKSYKIEMDRPELPIDTVEVL